MINELKSITSTNFIADCEKIYSLYGYSNIYKHVHSVFEMAVSITKNSNINLDKVKTAAYLHDISVVIPRNKYAEILKKFKISILDIEKQLPILLHQKVSGIIAKEVFNIKDDEILSAITCHTTLKSNPSTMDKLIFIADKLAWDQSGIPPYIRRVESALCKSLDAACLAYIDYIIENKTIIKPHPDLISAKVWLEKQI